MSIKFMANILFFWPLALTMAESNASNRGKAAQEIQDKVTGIVYYLDNDKKQVFAVDDKNRVLWKTKPYAKVKMRFANNSDPIIRDFYLPEKDWWGVNGFKLKTEDVIVIGFNTGQFGFLTKKDGEYFDLGKD